jgi:hypothetical protein
MTRDELRKIYTFLKKETGIEGVPSRSLGSKEEVLKEIRKIIEKTENTFLGKWHEALERNTELLYENAELKSELENLKNKKWWQIWKWH